MKVCTRTKTRILLIFRHNGVYARTIQSYSLVDPLRYIPEHRRVYVQHYGLAFNELSTRHRAFYFSQPIEYGRLSSFRVAR